jgi:hypothetical protein
LVTLGLDNECSIERRENTVSMVISSYFYNTPYSSLTSPLEAEEYLFLFETLALGFCNEGDQLEFGLYDGLSVIKTVRLRAAAGDVSLDSFWAHLVYKKDTSR